MYTFLQDQFRSSVKQRNSFVNLFEAITVISLLYPKAFHQFHQLLNQRIHRLSRISKKINTD